MRKSLLLLGLLFTSLHCFSKNLSPQNTTFTMYAAGDIADCRTKQSTANTEATAEIINAAIAKDPTTVVLNLGDSAYQIATPVEFETCYHPTWGKFKNRTYPTPGNHEYYIPKAYAYFQYFGSAAGSQQQPYYSFNKGAWHIISLDSNLKKEQQQAQMNWLAQDLKNNRAACILAFWHHPVFNSSFRGNDSKMRAEWELLMTAKADLVLSGHEHFYERFALQNSRGELDNQNGIRQFVVGTGGTKLTYAFWQKTNSEVLNTKVHGVLKLTLKNQSYEWQYLPINTTADIDRGSEICHKK